MPVCEVDLRVGGAWRFVIEKPNGKQVGMYGRYVELDPPPNRTVHTESFDDYPRRMYRHHAAHRVERQDHAGGHGPLSVG